MSGLSSIDAAMTHLMSEAKRTTNAPYAESCNHKLVNLCNMIHFEITQDRRLELIAKFQEALDNNEHESAAKYETMINELTG